MCFYLVKNHLTPLKKFNLWSPIYIFYVQLRMTEGEIFVFLSGWRMEYPFYSGQACSS